MSHPQRTHRLAAGADFRAHRAIRRADLGAVARIGRVGPEEGHREHYESKEESEHGVSLRAKCHRGLSNDGADRLRLEAARAQLRLVTLVERALAVDFDFPEAQAIAPLIPLAAAIAGASCLLAFDHAQMRAARSLRLRLR